MEKGCGDKSDAITRSCAANRSRTTDQNKIRHEHRQLANDASELGGKEESAMASYTPLYLIHKS